MSPLLSASQLSSYAITALLQAAVHFNSVCVCVCNRCIPHLSIITRVNISDDVMVSDR